MTVNYASHVNRKQTPQSEPIPGETQVQNNAGGYVYEAGKWQRLQRFLILGADGGTYYVREKKLTRDNAAVVEACLREDGRHTVDQIAGMSDSGRAPKNDAAIFALALATSVRQPDEKGQSGEQIRAYALGLLPRVCRIPTHLFQFLEACKALRRWSRMLRTAVAKWYDRWDADTLAFELVKYQQREGWANKDALRLSHAKLGPEKQAALRWAVGAPLLGIDGVRNVTRNNAPGKARAYYVPGAPLPDVIAAFEEAKTADADRLDYLIAAHKLTREMVPTEALNRARTWDALLPNMPLNAMVRNLAKMTAVGLLVPMGNGTSFVCGKLADAENLRKSRLHPMAILNALRVYQAGHGDKGSLTWTPVREIVDALDAAFYLAFGNVAPTGKRIMLALDVSGSMSSLIAGTGLSCREAAAAMALVTANVEPHWMAVGFTEGGAHKYANAKTDNRLTRQYYGYGHSISELIISPKQRLGDVVTYMNALGFGGTDCALPMLYADSRKLNVDAFCVYTDSETWAGNVHPSQALRDYRARHGKPDAACVVVGMTATEFTIADPQDPKMLDVVGFDLATPQAIAEFIK